MAWWKRSAQSSQEALAEGFPLIRLEGIGRVFDGDSEEPAVALRDVTVDIDRGEYISVSVPSGCGKSTFLSILALLDTPIPSDFLLMLPYVVTIIVVAGLVGRSRPPAADGQPYVVE